mmetsp:Transcript_32279/g.47491  ORF Transcript_32279/g.47491 Transcript_32279/m.47491 type:complete len:472 (-) Transcript_32279:307-1722(-)|eukprot:CAMPEP_0195535582 /NCGR_PEP_ID=MMETSP0794_2-20130614/44529_1 /TAXON_ID=515487 /ORGANISM="Stephanopyxis turris, Strain CCMP 815" /LENGTH=471 /DNA_ID=CAMNT_0040668761 /DNA_START=42 /DNA_END=1457 /DNA_ORIENTATION=+
MYDRRSLERGGSSKVPTQNNAITLKRCKFKGFFYVGNSNKSVLTESTDFSHCFSSKSRVTECNNENDDEPVECGTSTQSLSICSASSSTFSVASFDVSSTYSNSVSSLAVLCDADLEAGIDEDNEGKKTKQFDEKKVIEVSTPSNPLVAATFDSPLVKSLWISSLKSNSSPEVSCSADVEACSACNNEKEEGRQSVEKTSCGLSLKSNSFSAVSREEDSEGNNGEEEVPGPRNRHNSISEVSTEFRSSLQKYADVLSAKLRLVSPLGANVISMKEVVNVCQIIETCEYFWGKIQFLKDQPKKIFPIDMIAEQRRFRNTAAQGVRVLVTELDRRTNAAFDKMRAINWETIEEVIEDSGYVQSMHDDIHPFMEIVQRCLQPSCYRNICDEFSSVFTSRFFAFFTDGRRFGQSASQQLYLYFSKINTLILKLITMKNGSLSGAIMQDPCHEAIMRRFIRIDKFLIEMRNSPSKT